MNHSKICLIVAVIVLICIPDVVGACQIEPCLNYETIQGHFPSGIGENNGYFSNYSEIINQREFTNNGYLYNYGTLTNDPGLSGGWLNNYGYIFNYAGGTLSFDSGMSNYGYIFNYAGGTLVFGSGVSNYGYIFNFAGETLSINLGLSGGFEGESGSFCGGESLFITEASVAPSVASAPLPGSLLLLGIGLMRLAAYRRRKLASKN